MNARSNRLAATLAGSMLCAAACLAGQPAVAEESGVPTVKVYYGDLNLQRPASIVSLYRRIERAAERVCIRNNSRAVQQAHSARACTDQAIDRAIVSINMPALAKHASEIRARASEASG